MASLMKIAQEQAENLRDGAIWFIIWIWKTRRSWHAEAVALDRHNHTWNSTEDKKRASEILEKTRKPLYSAAAFAAVLAKNPPQRKSRKKSAGNMKTASIYCIRLCRRLQNRHQWQRQTEKRQSNILTLYH